MTQPTNNAKKFAISNAVVRKLKLPNSLLDNQLFANGVYGAYSGYRHSNYYYHRYLNKKVCKDAQPLNFKPYEFKESQFAGFDFAPTIGLSIIIPAYNVEKFIVACLESIMNALDGYDDFEIIVVEDCSTDNTREVLLEIQKNYKNLQLLLNESNLGLSASRNRAIKNSKGLYITFVDSDDMLVYGVLSQAIDIATKKNVDIVEFNFAQFFKESDVSQFLSLNDSQNEKDAHIEITSEISKSAKGFAWGKLYKRELFDKVRFPEGLYWEDAIIGNIVLNMANTYVGLNKVGYLYRSNPNSISNSLIKRNLGYDQMYVIKYCLEMAKKNHLKMDNDFYKRLFLEASVFLNNRTGYLSDSDILYMFEELNNIFDFNKLKEILAPKEILILKSMQEKNVKAWRAISY